LLIGKLMLYRKRISMKQPANTQKNRTLFSVLCVACIDNFGFGLVFILFAPLLLNPEYGMVSSTASLSDRNTLLGILYLSFPLMQFFGAPLLGDIADRFGRKKAFYVTIAAASLGYLLSAIAISVHSYSFLLISRLWTGFFAGNLSICLASIADLSHDEQSRARNFSWVTVVWGFSWPIAILVGGYLSDPSVSKYFNPAVPFYITLVLSLASLGAIKILFKETHPRSAHVPIDLLKGIHNVAMSLKVKALRPFFSILLLWTIGWGITVQWYGAYSIEKFAIAQEIVSWGLVIQGMFWVIGGSCLNPFLLKRFSTKSAGVIGLVIAIVFVVSSSLATSFWSFSWIYFMAAMGAAFSLSNTMNLCSLAAPKSIQGKAMGLSQSMMSLGWLIVPIIGALMGNLDITLFYPVCGLFLLASCLLLIKSKVPVASI
jgi:DHA1 family tetracycline resistance protein-like MFS transporter